MNSRFAVFASGNGSNFEAIVKAKQTGDIQGKLACLICDKEDAFVIERAKQFGITYYVVEKKVEQTKEAYESTILDILMWHDVNFIVLAGYMKIIGETLLQHFDGHIINLHPSLLPKYPGKQSIKECYEAGECETGITIHYVDQGIDTGPIIFQERLDILEEETLEMVEEHVHELEHQWFPVIINQCLIKECTK